LPRSDAWFSLGAIRSEPQPDFAGELAMTVRALSGERLRFEEAKLVPAVQQLHVTVTNPSVRFVAVTGRLVPSGYGYRHHDYRVSVNGREIDRVMCDPNPNASVNASRTVVEMQEGQTEYDVRWHGAGIIQPQLLPVEKTLKFSLTERRFMVLFNGVYGWEQDETGEHFCWTRETMKARVPLSGAFRYHLRFKALDGHPVEPRTLGVSFAGQREEIAMARTQDWYAVVFDAPADNDGVGLVEFEIPTWSPAELLGVNDGRELGFRIYALEWVPGE
jgi:hypothetical protein